MVLAKLDTRTAPIFRVVTNSFLHKIFVFYFSKQENYLSRSGYWRNRFWINDWTVAVLCRWSLTKLGVLSCLNSLSLPPYLPAYRPIHRIYIEYRYKDINIEHRYTFLYSGWDANRISIRVGKQTAGQRCCLSLPRLSSSTKLRRSFWRLVAFIATSKLARLGQSWVNFSTLVRKRKLL